MALEMRIPDPKLRPGHDCWVRNYRSRARTWERGRVEAMRYESTSGDRFIWWFYVVLERRGKNDFPIRLYVGPGDVLPC